MLPASLLTAVESHGCFSGCYGSQTDVMVSVAPTQPVERVLQVSCSDCLVFHAGALASDVSPGSSATTLARELSAHMRRLRGYAWSIGGYHSKGLWLSAAYYSCGVFLVNGEHNRPPYDHLDCLIEGFRRGIAAPVHPGMLAVSNYCTRTIYVDMRRPIAPVRSSGDILGSSQCSVTPKLGYQEVLLAEFLPVMQHQAATRVTANVAAAPAAVAATPAGTATPTTTAPIRRPLRLGERCVMCGALVEERPSLTDTYIGCLC